MTISSQSRPADILSFPVGGRSGMRRLSFANATGVLVTDRFSLRQSPVVDWEASYHADAVADEADRGRGH
ncbi:DUF2735 domain-containing protein [Fulvimarina endophytica]|uniref:DUF2735 domain-containing protein n=1 Tax=Fulvimarina endophytica TaxID=2293836 RepID=A0A371XAM2_9HYPH|nr:DUF2735 domain-containing protein [Fulvimarina endophytica]RFC66285.1 DUF2735 domain-containing protein [Fulvimarina endophytica]